MEKKVGIVVTVHWSEEIRPNGDFLLKRFLDSLYQYCTHNFCIYIIDNESQFNLNVPNEKTKYIRIEDQNKKGLTGAWNLGLNTAYNDGCDIIINCNEDLWFNETINYFIDKIDLDNDEDVIYSSFTNGVHSPYKNYSNGEPREDLSLDLSKDYLNGFLFAFNRNHYYKFRYKNDQYFNVNNKYNGGDGKWGGQEGQFTENAEHGARGLIVGKAFTFHDKIRAWRVGKRLDEGSN